MRFELRRLTDYSDQAIFQEIRRVAALVKQPTLSATEFRKHSRVHSSTAVKRFGGWRKALEAAGLSVRIDSSNQPVPREDAISELRRVAEVLQTKSFTKQQFEGHARFRADVVTRRFGTWHRAMRAAGLDTIALGKRYTDEECFENLLTVWTHHGRAPKHREMKYPPSTVGPKAYVLRFATWTKALQAFVDRVNADTTEDAKPPEEPSERVLASKRKSVCEADRRDIRLGMRYSVLVRDRFRCVLCGSSPATQTTQNLHIDHVFPVAKGGKTTPENLRVLCEECNLGKGSRTEGVSLDR